MKAIKISISSFLCLFSIAFLSCFIENSYANDLKWDEQKQIYLLNIAYQKEHFHKMFLEHQKVNNYLSRITSSEEEKEQIDLKMLEVTNLYNLINKNLTKKESQEFDQNQDFPDSELRPIKSFRVDVSQNQVSFIRKKTVLNLNDLTSFYNTHKPEYVFLDEEFKDYETAIANNIKPIAPKKIDEETEYAPDPNKYKETRLLVFKIAILAIIILAFLGLYLSRKQKIVVYANLTDVFCTLASIILPLLLSLITMYLGFIEKMTIVLYITFLVMVIYVGVATYRYNRSINANILGFIIAMNSKMFFSTIYIIIMCGLIFGNGKKKDKMKKSTATGIYAVLVYFGLWTNNVVSLNDYWSGRWESIDSDSSSAN